MALCCPAWSLLGVDVVLCVCVCVSGLMLCGRVVTTWLLTHLRCSKGRAPSLGLSLALWVRGLALVCVGYWLHVSGVSVLNRWTMSVSYVLLGAGTAQLGLVAAYVATGPSGGAWTSAWMGEPLAAAGRASLLIYIGHSLLKVPVHTLSLTHTPHTSAHASSASAASLITCVLSLLSVLC